MPRHPARGLICLVCCLNCSRKSLKVRKRSRLLPRQASEFKLMFRVIRRRGKQFRASHLFTFSMPRFGILRTSYSNFRLLIINEVGGKKTELQKKDCKITKGALLLHDVLKFPNSFTINTYFVSNQYSSLY